VVWVLLGLASAAVMLPRLVSPSFGLLDDGLIPVVSAMPMPEASWTFDRGYGRLRPLFWLWLAAEYRAWGASPRAFFLALCAALAITAVLVSESVALAARDRLTGLLAGLGFLLAPPAVENYYTVSKSEPWVVLALVLSVYLLLRALDVAERDPRTSRRHLAASALVLLAAYFWKETAQAMLIASGLWFAGAWVRDRRVSRPLTRIALAYLLVNIGCAALYWAAFALSGTASIGAGTYSAHYQLTADTMVKGALRQLGFLVRDFPLLLVAGAVWAVRDAAGIGARSHDARSLAWASAAWMGAWIAILLPWRATFEYHLLPLAAGAAALTAVALRPLFRATDGRALRRRWLMLAAAAALTLAVLVNNATNGQIQIAVDGSNADMMEFVAAVAPRGATVLVNLTPGSEYVSELRDHLAEFRGRPDLRVKALRGAGPAAVALILHPLMRQQPTPAVRLGFGEGDTQTRTAELARWRSHEPVLVYRRTRDVPMFDVALQDVVCPLLLVAGVRDGVACGAARPFVDRRTLQYGWEVYRIGPPDPSANYS